METTIAPAPLARFVKLATAAESSGISVEVLRRWIRQRKLTVYRPHRRLLLDADELENFIRSFKTA